MVALYVHVHVCIHGVRNHFRISIVTFLVCKIMNKIMFLHEFHTKKLATKVYDLVTIFFPISGQHVAERKLKLILSLEDG